MARWYLVGRACGVFLRILTKRLRCDAVAAGVNHIDTSDFYGPSVTNQLIKHVLHPYPDDLVIVTKVGYRRGSAKSWLPALSRHELIQAVEGNLRNLGLDVLDVVNIWGTSPGESE